MLCMINRQILFQSTLPARGATPILMLCLRHNQFQSTLPARGATTFGALKDMIENISIHAPRTGSDNGRVLEADALTIISIHAPRTGSDFRISQMGVHLAFQSTLPARGATMFLPLTGNRLKFQSTLPARGATLLQRRRLT